MSQPLGEGIHVAHQHTVFPPLHLYLYSSWGYYANLKKDNVVLAIDVQYTVKGLKMILLSIIESLEQLLTMIYLFLGHPCIMHRLTATSTVLRFW